MNDYKEVEKKEIYCEIPSWLSLMLILFIIVTAADIINNNTKKLINKICFIKKYF